MKNLLLGSIALTLFAVSITLFQISCQKVAQAQTTTYTLPAATTTALGGVVIGNGLSITSSGTLSINSTAGTYTLPAGTSSTLGGFIVGNGLSVTSSGVLSATNTGVTQPNLIVYFKSNNVSGIVDIYTAKQDGSNQTKINLAST